MSVPDDVREWPLSRRLELRGRLAFGEAMTDPDEAAIAAAVGRQQLRQAIWVVLALLVGLVAWLVIGRSLDPVLVGLFAFFAVSLLVTTRKAIAANDRVVAGARKAD